MTVTDMHKNASQCETFVKWHSDVACIKSSLCKTGVTFMETRVVDLNKQSNQCVNLKRPAENMFHPKIKTKKNFFRNIKGFSFKNVLVPNLYEFHSSAEHKRRNFEINYKISSFIMHKSNKLILVCFLGGLSF